MRCGFVLLEKGRCKGGGRCRGGAGAECLRSLAQHLGEGMLQCRLVLQARRGGRRRVSAGDAGAKGLCVEHK